MQAYTSAVLYVAVGVGSCWECVHPVVLYVCLHVLSDGTRFYNSCHIKLLFTFVGAALGRLSGEVLDTMFPEGISGYPILAGPYAVVGEEGRDWCKHTQTLNQIFQLAVLSICLTICK